jgi:hypothetical protein
MNHLDYSKDSRYEDSRYEDSRYEDQRYEDSRYEDTRYDTTRYDSHYSHSPREVRADKQNLVDAVYENKTNIGRIRKNFNVTVELVTGEVYDVYFRSNRTTAETEQSAVLKYIFINKKLGCLPSLVDNHLLYINVENGDVELKYNNSEEQMPYYEGFELVTYDMFEGARWSGCFKHPPL